MYRVTKMGLNLEHQLSKKTLPMVSLIALKISKWQGGVQFSYRMPTPNSWKVTLTTLLWDLIEKRPLKWTFLKEAKNWFIQ